MNGKVIKRFKDKYAGGLYTPGDLFEAEAARMEHLIGLGYIEPLGSIEKAPTKTKTAKKK